MIYIKLTLFKVYIVEFTDRHLLMIQTVMHLINHPNHNLVLSNAQVNAFSRTGPVGHDVHPITVTILQTSIINMVFVNEYDKESSQILTLIQVLQCSI